MQIKHKLQDFVRALVEGWFDERTQEQFETDLTEAIRQAKE